MAARSDGDLYLYIKRVRDEAATFGLPYDYNDRWDEAEYPYEPVMDLSLEAFMPLFEAAYKRSAFGA